MKTSKDPRHQYRRNLVRKLFAYSFNPDQPFTTQEEKLISQFPKIDKYIGTSAPEWPVDKINKTDLAILRLAVYELVVKQEEPDKVVIDEAIELAKEFGSDHSPSFINGVLGNILKGIEQ